MRAVAAGLLPAMSLVVAAAAETLGFAASSFARAISRDAAARPDGLALDRIETFLPATGACTALSAAFDVKAVRAFAIRPVNEALAAPAALR